MSQIIFKMNFLNFTVLFASAFYVSSASSATITRPIACEGTEDHDVFVTKIKSIIGSTTTDDVSKQTQLAAIFNCPNSYKRFKEVVVADFDAPIPDVLKASLLNVLNQLQYGTLQLDNDRSFLKCVDKIHETIKNYWTDWDKFKSDINYGKPGNPCGKVFMTIKIDQMIGKLKDVSGPENIKAAIKNEISWFDYKKAQVMITASKPYETEKYEAREGIKNLLKGNNQSIDSKLAKLEIITYSDTVTF